MIWGICKKMNYSYLSCILFYLAFWLNSPKFLPSRNDPQLSISKTARSVGILEWSKTNIWRICVGQGIKVKPNKQNTEPRVCVGFTCMSAINRKKALAARLICSYRNRGRKVSTPYLVVLQEKTRRELYLLTFRKMAAETKKLQQKYTDIREQH